MNTFTYSHGDLSIRPQQVEDAEAHLVGEDDQQRIWLWDADAREQAAATPPGDRLERTRAWIESNRAAFATGGPKYCFSVTVDDALVGYIDAHTKLDAEPGVANIAYVVYPAFRRRGYTTRAVGLILEFLRAHTDIAIARLIIDESNAPSIGVAAATGFMPTGASLDASAPGLRFQHPVR